MRSRPLVLVCLLAALFGGVAASDRSAALLRPDAVVLFTGYVEGYLDQCGCDKNPMGGLDRRQGYLTSLRRLWRDVPIALLDTGNFADTPTVSGIDKTKSLIDGMGMLGYAAAAIGERELLALRDLPDLTENKNPSFLSANLLLAEQQKLLFGPSQTLELSGIRIGVTAITRPNSTVEFRTRDRALLQITDPVAALTPIVERLRTDHDLVMVLAPVPLEEAVVLARRVPGIDFILGSFGPRVTERPVVEGTTQIVYNGDQGKAFGQIEIYPERNGARAFEIRIAGLGDAVSRDEAMNSFVMQRMQRAHDAEIQALMAPSDQPAAQDDQATFVGNGACTVCHAAEVNDWAKSRHARAWKTLVDQDGAQPRAVCLSCHTTGAGTPSGFVSYRQSPHLVGVGCESCHGPGSLHRARPEAPYGASSIATCTKCHDAANDKDFDFYRDRAKIDHKD